jgi:hypothetical protein
MDTGDLEAALSTFTELGDYKDSASIVSHLKTMTCQVGDYIHFGEYTKDGDASTPEKIEWLVLDVKDNRALIISSRAVDGKKYDTNGNDVTWETCTLRTWLNNDFFNVAFNAEEQARIPTVTVPADEIKSYIYNDRNSVITTDPGNDTQDKIFVLSIKEVEKYLPSRNDRLVIPAKEFNYPGYVSWWLRTVNKGNTTAAVTHEGDIMGDYSWTDEKGLDGGMTNNSDLAVRPAMWIDLSA